MVGLLTTRNLPSVPKYLNSYTPPSMCNTNSRIPDNAGVVLTLELPPTLPTVAAK